MKRRTYLSAFVAGGLGGCLSERTEGDGPNTSNVTGSKLVPSENWTDEEIADTAFDESATPICVDGEERDGTVENQPGATITDHHFFYDGSTGRYGLGGRIEFHGGGYFQRTRATFVGSSTEITVADREFYQVTPGAYLFTIVAPEGNHAAVERYELDAPDGATADPGPTVEDGTELVKEGWGKLGEADGVSVYGAAVTIRNASSVTGEGQVIVEAVLNDGTVVHNEQGSVELRPGETETFYFPYHRCDPGSVTEIQVQHSLFEL
ncbi:hypothetical protein ACLI4R_12930 [Natrialbaceae archaeon A-chndr2]|uniref:hypothetical protein n=1 Tax=Natronosalvus amylolyticus TaxID=2961994 RepID=UPI0020C9535C|nr:hypothetical protein [Natronosalvus amylolyticus]